MTRGVPSYNYPDGSQPHYVYRAFDAAGRLIYVGCSLDPEARVANHRMTSWWADQIERVEFTPAGSRDAARRAERRTIIGERPRWNVKSRWPSVQGEALESALDYEVAFLACGNTDTAWGRSHLASVRRLIAAKSEPAA